MPARSATHSPVAANRNTTDSWKALTYSASAPEDIAEGARITSRAPRAGSVHDRAAICRRAGAERSGVFDRRRDQQGQHEQRLHDVGHPAGRPRWRRGNSIRCAGRRRRTPWGSPRGRGCGRRGRRADHPSHSSRSSRPTTGRRMPRRSAARRRRRRRSTPTPRARRPSTAGGARRSAGRRVD